MLPPRRFYTTKTHQRQFVGCYAAAHRAYPDLLAGREHARNIPLAYMGDQLALRRTKCRLTLIAP